uniref:Histidine acid phosphatase n=1 Tax=Panagrellus redivivus TaxID=6233 RepID=A0A7E4V0H5_PANRE
MLAEFRGRWIAFLVVFVVKVCADQLVLVQSVFRHGDRTPEGRYPTDPYKESFWPASYGELTTVGMQQQLTQGLKLRARYQVEENFLPKDYKDFNIYVRSSDVNRTLMSAYSQLEGFFSASSNTYPSENAVWPGRYTPVPVHTVDILTDNLMIASLPCARRTQLQQARAKNAQYQAFIAQQRPLLNTIAQNGGFNGTSSSFDPYKAFTDFYSSISVETIYNLQLPDWVTPALWLEFTYGNYRSNEFLAGEAGFGVPEDPELLSLGGGTLLQTLISNMDLAISGSSKVRYRMFSGHETTLGALLRTLGAKEALLGLPLSDYAAVLLFELWKSTTNYKDYYYIRMVYSANDHSPFKTVTQLIKGCSGASNCDLNAFKSRSEPYFPKGGNMTYACVTQ